jgi:hypothetical protein
VPRAQSLAAGDIDILEAGLIDDINAAIAAWGSPIPPTDAFLTQIAIGIQLWGGRTGRQPFISRGGFASNFEPGEYRDIINNLMAPPLIGIAGLPFPALQQAVNRWGARNSTRELLFFGFNVSFATKHFSFWSRALGMPTRLPIYDKIIARYFMGLPPRWNDYWTYVNGMRDDVGAINAANPAFPRPYTVHDLERQLFVWANSPAPARTGWPRR